MSSLAVVKFSTLTKAVAAFISIVLIGELSFAARAVTPSMPRRLPGQAIGDVSSRWVAPYVLATSYRVAGAEQSSVSWFDESGRMVKELSGAGLDARGEYISETTGNETTIYDVNGKWKFLLPHKEGPSGYITGVGDTFVHDFHPGEGQIAVDVYFQGRLAGTAGPFVQYFTASDVQLASDGNMALLTWKTPQKQAAQVVVIGPDGKLRLQADCPPGSVPSYIYPPFGGGRGVLMRFEAFPKPPPVRFSFKMAGGNWITRDIGTNALPMECVLPGDLVLFDLSIGEEERFQLVDGATGNTIWEIPSPVQPWSHSISGVTALEDLLVFVGQDLAAVSLKTGKLISCWKPDASRADRGGFARRGTQVFFIAGDRFSEITPEDIAAKRNGWR